MDKTNTLYQELKNKIQGLVEFMVANDLDATNINLEVNGNFTMCNVNYMKEETVKKEFMYFFDRKDILTQKIQDRIENNPSLTVDKINTDTSESEISIEDDLKYIKDEETIDTNSVDSTNENKMDINSQKEEVEEVEQKELSSEENNLSDNKTSDKNKSQDNSTTTNSNKSSSTPKTLNFKEEYLYQKEFISNILKEYNLIQ